MKQTFSQRNNFRSGRLELQLYGIDDELRLGLWNMLYSEFVLNGLLEHPHRRIDFLNAVGRFRKTPIDVIQNHIYYDNCDFFVEEIKSLLFDKETEWYTIYDLLEFLSECGESGFQEACNEVLGSEMSGYRLINGCVTPITSEIEVNEIESAIDNGNSLWSEHLTAAQLLLSNRTNPDYRNSIKESISAVECVAKEISGDKNAELKVALKKLENNLDKPLHEALKQGLLKIYGYTSDGDGIRHALTDKADVGFDDAKFMLVSCSAFVNYLISKSK